MFSVFKFLFVFAATNVFIKKISCKNSPMLQCTVPWLFRTAWHNLYLEEIL